MGHGPRATVAGDSRLLFFLLACSALIERCYNFFTSSGAGDRGIVTKVYALVLVSPITLPVAIVSSVAIPMPPSPVFATIMPSVVSTIPRPSRVVRISSNINLGYEAGFGLGP